MKVCPNDKAARMKYSECKKIVHQQAFAKAIAVDDKRSVVESLDLESMGKEISYTVPQPLLLRRYC